MIFDAFFKKATEYDPFPFQKRFAEADEIPSLVNVPTGLGKTAMAIVGWLWRRFEAPETLRRATPRRLIYTLPMRVLVEQTRDNAIRWLQNLNLLGGHAQWDNDGRVASYEPSSELPGKVAVYVLMGGEEQYDWEIFPEREAILIGTQDMLLSRALNRGYAASRSRWPMQFGLLHTDALWVFDEVQLMGEGLATSAQLEAFRHRLGHADGHGSRSVWMSATLQKEWLQTVDFREKAETFSCLSLDTCDKEKAAKRWNASKKLQKTKAHQGNYQTLAEEIRTHHSPGTLTLVVVNTVERARELSDQLSKLTSGTTSKKTKNKGISDSQNPDPELVLLHSRFRPIDRTKQIEKALRPPGAAGTIVISTQVVEAGVDISATNLFTEVAPWASLIQRFGRCNRKGENANASIWWIPLPEKPNENDARPYRLNDLIRAAEQLESLNDKEISLQSLDVHCRAMAPEVLNALFPYVPAHVLRRKDLIELFDTTPDLAGNDLDIDRFIRDAEESDIHVFWRDFDQNRNPGSDIAPKPDELCPVPFYEFRDFLKRRSIKAWRWNFLDERWEAVSPQQVVPGQIVLLHKSSGGYTPEKGCDPESKSAVTPVSLEITPATLDATDADPLTTIGMWKTIAEHSDDVVTQIKDLLAALPFLEDEHRVLLETAARWHDRGKAHPTFQAALPDGAPPDAHLWAKAQGKLKKYAELGRPHFRHELASALAVLMSPPALIPPEWRDLVAYLVAAHHGKVRLSIRSLPGEKRPDSPADGPSRELRFARGIWEGDTLPETDLGGGITAPAATLSLEPMEMGLCETPPFEGQPSWAERMVRLRDRLGPFHLAFLEAIVRAADWRASRMAGKGSVP